MRTAHENPCDFFLHSVQPVNIPLGFPIVPAQSGVQFVSITHLGVSPQRQTWNYFSMSKALSSPNKLIHTQAQRMGQAVKNRYRNQTICGAKTQNLEK